jgi:threonine dehydrogenase-like Zn-dependent dehydrogenase
MTEKCIALKSARGHGYRAVEQALELLASRRFPLERLGTHRFGLEDVDRAIRAVGGELEEDAIHVSLMPWGAAA